MEIRIENIEGIKKAAKEFISAIADNKIFAFYGKMGVGKTTLIKAICEELGVDNDSINSPTFAIVNEYIGKNKITIYHFDFYRIEDVNEAYDFGYEDYFYNNSFCFIEWPEKIEEILPPNTVEVSIEEVSGERVVNISQI